MSKALRISIGLAALVGILLFVSQVADTVVWLGRALGLWSLERDGFNWVYQLAVQLGHAALAVVSLILACRTIERWLGDRRAAVTGVLAVWAASPLIYYQTINVSMSHGAAFFLVSVLAFALERATGRDSAEDGPLRHPSAIADLTQRFCRSWPARRGCFSERGDPGGRRCVSWRSPRPRGIPIL